MFRIFLLLGLLVPSFAVFAAVPTDYGNPAFQRTPYDTSNKHALWCTSFSYTGNATATVATDINGIPYYLLNDDAILGSIVWDHSPMCAHQHSPAQVAPPMSFVSTITDSPEYNWYFVIDYDSESFFGTGTSTSVSQIYYYDSNGFIKNAPQDYQRPDNDYATSTVKTFSYNSQDYRLIRIENWTAPSTTIQAAVPAEMEMFSWGGALDYKLYAVIYTSQNILSDITNSTELVDYLNNLNGSTGSTTTAPVIVNENTINRVNTPNNAQVFSLGSASTKNVRVSYDYSIADATYSRAYVELTNLSTGYSYVVPEQSIISSGFLTYDVTFTLPAGHYMWRPVLSSTDYATKKYFADGRNFTFTVAGNTSDWWGSYTVASNTASTTYVVSETMWGTSTIRLGTTTFDMSAVNLSVLDFGEGVCGVNMSCAIPLCLEHPDICNRFPFAAAIDIFGIMQTWNGVINSGVVHAIEYNLDLGVSSTTITMLDLTEGSLTDRLADKTHYWSSLLIWLVFGFWSFTFVSKFLS